MSYGDAALLFLTDYLYPFCPAVPELQQPIMFPWDIFCEHNPGLLDVERRFLAERHYELSEHQCSWACMKYRQEVAWLWD